MIMRCAAAPPSPLVPPVLPSLPCKPSCTFVRATLVPLAKGLAVSSARACQVYKDGEAVRAPVALAIVKLLKRLPEAALRAALPTSLQKVANLLRTRLQRIR